MGNFLGKCFVWGMSKNVQIQMYKWLKNLFSSNLNTMKLKLFRNHGVIYKLEKKINKYYGQINPLGVHRNKGGCILEVNSEGLG